MIEQGVVALLLARPAITALIGMKVYAVLLPPDVVYPALTYHTTSKPPEVSLDGTAIFGTRFQLDCWSNNYPDVKLLQAEIHNLLDGFRGLLSDGTVVKDSARSVESDFFENDSETFRSSTEYLLTF